MEAAAAAMAEGQGEAPGMRLRHGRSRAADASSTLGDCNSWSQVLHFVSQQPSEPSASDFSIARAAIAVQKAYPKIWLRFGTLCVGLGVVDAEGGGVGGWKEIAKLLFALTASCILACLVQVL